MLDTQLQALSNKYRRRLLVSLLEMNPQEELVIPESISSSEPDREVVHAQMVHMHLPLLEEAGFVRWNWFTNEVRKGPQFDEIRPLLELLGDNADELPEDWC